MRKQIFHTLWIGSRLSVMAKLCVRSFLAHGYEFCLYAYQEIEDVPAGTTVRRADEILPADQVFCYRKGYGKGSSSAFSNCFRYKLLLERGGWWTDLDSVCMRTMDFDDEHVLGEERTPDGRRQIGSGLMKAPAGSPLMQYCWDTASRVDRSALVWGQIGPRLVTEAARTVRVPLRILAPEAFFPVDYWNVWQFVAGGPLPPDCYSIHLWNSRWLREGLDPDARYADDCIYERLKCRFGVVSPTGAACGPGWRSSLRHWWRQWKPARRRAA